MEVLRALYGCLPDSKLFWLVEGKGCSLISGLLVQTDASVGPDGIR